MVKVDVEAARTELSRRLTVRRSEIEQALITRVEALSGPAETLDPEYVVGLHAAVTAALDYGLGLVDGGAERNRPVPAPLLAQARLAAGNGVALDTVLRRYLAGYTLLNDYIFEEAANIELSGGGTLRHLLRSQAVRFDRLLKAVSDEYAREAGARPLSSEQRRAELVRGLLAGELVDAGELSYDLEAEHLGAVALGPDAETALRDLAVTLDRNLLLISGGEGAVWAWLGGRRTLARSAVDTALADSGRDRARLAIGEPASGLAGWRLTHRQAKAAALVAQRNEQHLVRYADVALLVAVLQDELLATSLRESYLTPLEAERDGGRVLRETLRAYFAAGGNISSAASTLDLNRATVRSRLVAIEGKIGRPIDTASAEIEAALRLAEIDGD